MLKSFLSLWGKRIVARRLHVLEVNSSRLQEAV